MASAADTKKNKQQGDFLETSDTEESLLPSGGTIADIAESATLKKQKNGPQKDCVIAPLGGIVTVAIPAASELERHEYQDESSFVEINKE